jgi:hypothetical protein
LVGETLGMTQVQTVLFITILVAITLVGLRSLTRRRPFRFGAGEWPFYLRRLMSQPEQVLYHRLIRALPDHIVLAQVQVSRVLGVKRGFNFNEWNNRINRLSYDFVICAQDSAVIAAIELDDKTHESETRILTDGKKDKATADAGLRLIRWNVRALPSEGAIRDELLGPSLVSQALAPAEGRLVLPSILIERDQKR